MKMEFDSMEVHKSLSLMKQIEALMLSYRLVFEFVAESGHFDKLVLYSKLKEAEATVQSQMNEKYDAALRTLEGVTDQASALKALQFLAEWKPKGRPQ
jgi:hypothetical protein